MTTTTKTNASETNWQAVGNGIMFRLYNEYKEFTADDFYLLARRHAMPPYWVKKMVGALFRQYAASAYIRKTDKYRLSERNGSTPLPIWQSCKQEASL